MKTFLSKFSFDPSRRGCFGVEREFFLFDAHGRPVPKSPKFLAHIADPAWTHELSACQVEHRTAPHRSAQDMRHDLAYGWLQGRTVAASVGALLTETEVGPADMPLDVFPEPRYLQIAASIPQETLLAACRVAGVHVHYGVADLDDALWCYNRLVGHLDELCRLGDHSGGECLATYKVMAKNWEPPSYRSPGHLHEVALEQGFAENPRNCWHLIRISRHGTVELRMFGMTDEDDEILGWIGRILQILGT